MIRAWIILMLIFLLAGCAGPYARRNQVAEGMTEQEIAKISRANPIYSCRQLYENNNGVTYRLFLLDTHRNLRPYKCRFSQDGVLLSIGLDYSYEEFILLENAAAFIRNQRDMRHYEPVYWKE